MRSVVLCLLAACGSSSTNPLDPDASAPDAPPPLALTRITPDDGSQQNLASTILVSATLSAPLDCTSVTDDSLQVTRQGTRVAGRVLCNGNTLAFEPTASFPTRTQLVATLAANLRDMAGGILPDATSWSFGMAGWTLQFDSNLEAVATAIDGANNLYLAGYTLGALPGHTNAGAYDVFVTKLGPNGNVIWSQQFGSAAHDHALAVAVASDGSVYVGGMTQGSLDGTSAGGSDMFIAKLDASGTRVWTRQIGSAAYDRLESLTVDGTGNVVASGFTSGNFDGGTLAGGFDLVVLKYASDGTKQWTRQFGTSSDDLSYAVSAAPSGDIHVGCQTLGALDGQTTAGGWDACVVKYNAAGTRQWTKLIGTTLMDTVAAISFDPNNNVCVVGSTYGSLASTNPGPNNGFGTPDIYALKLDGTPAQVWAHQFGGENNDDTRGGHVDSAGNVYVVGQSYNDLDGAGSHQGTGDMFVAKYDASGAQQWVRMLGSPVTDYGLSVRTDSLGNVFVAGFSLGAIDGGTASGNGSVFLVKYSPSGVLQ